MAKRKPTSTLEDMQKTLGYNIDSLTYPNKNVKRFYSDLRPVSVSVYERTRREFEEYQKQRLYKEYKTISEKILPEFDIPRTIAHGQDTVTFTRWSYFGFYNFFVDIHYNFGFDLPLLLTKIEVLRAMSIARLPTNATCGLGPIFFKLPKEIRDKIYMYTLSEGQWKIGVDSSIDLNFPRHIGNPSGFYYLLYNLAILRINRQMRQEALPIAYCRTMFYLDDIDDLIKFLIAIGDTSRDKIESLELAWQSRIDFECQWAEAVDPNEYSLTLPTLHVAKCVQLLKQCKNLRFLRLFFESDLVQGMLPDAYKANPGLCELCSTRGIERVEIWDLGYEPLDYPDFVKWLKEAIESSEQD